jgi:N-acyl homoserine lactone hydrolase
MELYLLDGGIIEADRALIHPGDDSHRHVTMPIPQLLIQTLGRNILIDTGLPVSAYGDSDALSREHGTDPAWIKPIASPDQRIDAQLRHLGLETSDLHDVVCTHLHFDHCGGNALFAGILPIAVQEAELIAARESDRYMPVWDAPGLQFRPVKGDWSPAPCVEILFTPGHTPGHQSVLLRFSDSTLLFTIDAVYTEEHWRVGSLGVVTDVPSARASIDKLRELARAESARVIFGHDIGQWTALGMGDGKPHLIESDES